MKTSTLPDSCDLTFNRLIRGGFITASDIEQRLVGLLSKFAHVFRCFESRMQMFNKFYDFLDSNKCSAAQYKKDWGHSRKSELWPAINQRAAASGSSYGN